MNKCNCINIAVRSDYSSGTKQLASACFVSVSETYSNINRFQLAGLMGRHWKSGPKNWWEVGGWAQKWVGGGIGTLKNDGSGRLTPKTYGRLEVEVSYRTPSVLLTNVSMQIF